MNIYAHLTNNKWNFTFVFCNRPAMMCCSTFRRKLKARSPRAQSKIASSIKMPPAKHSMQTALQLNIRRWRTFEMHSRTSCSNVYVTQSSRKAHKWKWLWLRCANGCQLTAIFSLIRTTLVCFDEQTLFMSKAMAVFFSMPQQPSAGVVYNLKKSLTMR